MEKNYSFAALLFLSTTGLLAQSWCPPGATWTYESAAWGIEFRSQYSYASDTALLGMNAQKIDVHDLGSNGGGDVIENFYTQFTAWEDSIVWLYDDVTAEPMWDTLYWFAAVPGDRWYPPYAPANCPPMGMMEVVDTAHVLIDGLSLRTWEMAFLDESGGQMSPTFMITERVGSERRVPETLDCMIIIEYFMNTFICYADDEISTGDEPCLLTTSTEEPLIGMENVSIYPNPGSSGFSINGMDGPGATCRILDLQGREVIGSQTLGDQNQINTTSLLPGTYLIDLRTPDGKSRIMNWIKSE